MNILEWHKKRLSYGVENRILFNLDYFGLDTPFTYGTEYDCWFCEKCNGWEKVSEDYNKLICLNCGLPCAELNGVMNFGKHKGKKYSEIPDDYFNWLRASDKKKQEADQDNYY